MADAYWRYAEPPRQQPQQPPSQSIHTFSGKRSRTDFDIPSVPEISGFHDDDVPPARVLRDSESISASYDQYLRETSSRAISSGIPPRVVEEPHLVGMGNVGERPEVPLPPDATNTLFVEGLPSNCTRREVAHIFRPFVGYKEVRLVNKEPRHPGHDPLVLGFVDFISPAHAATAMDALQGYLFDENDRNSVRLRFQFARYPGARTTGAGYRGKR